MTLSPMRYKNYIWPHNPQVYSIDYQRKMAVNKAPFGLFRLQDMGRTCRVMEGQGEFVGEGAYAQFGQLANVFYDAGPGPLMHPLWQTANAYFVSLRLEQSPRPDYVRYAFTFWEDDGSHTGLAVPVAAAASAASGAAPAAANQTYRVRKGDTLWAIAKNHGLSLSELIALNPQIKNPNLIYAGDEVRVR